MSAVRNIPVEEMTIVTEYRVLNLLGALLGLLLAAPLMLASALVIRLVMGPPVLFRQVRVGRDERPFTLYKLRTMDEPRDAHGELLPASARLTRLGRCLRYLSLDELPQLWNVLIGDMSLVGPRPLHVQYLPYYTDRERRRHLVRPGLTGLAQVSGRNSLGWDERLEMDARYVETRSVALDLQILWRTARKVVDRSDVRDTPVEGSLADHRRGLVSREPG
jgi:lipopolysaccharide/colanic/teichoic acid biosynthesis glycosyltransferase